MSKSIKIGIVSFICCLIILISSNVYAASASITANKSSVTVGDKVKVTVKINAAAWSLETSGSVSEKIAGGNMSGKNKTTSKTYTFKPSKAGTYTVKLNGDITDANDKLSLINKSVSINVKAKTSNNTSTNNNGNTTNNNNNNNNNNTSDNNGSSVGEKSSDATLSNLGVSPSKYDFKGFKKSTTGANGEYKVTVPNDVTKLSVYASPTSSKAKYWVTGNRGFKVGTNIIKVTVTAENGNTKTYRIYVTREAKEEETIPNVTDGQNGDGENKESGIGLETLEIEGYELDPQFDSNVYNYNVEIGEQEFFIEDIKELIIAKSNYEKAEIDIDVEEGSGDDYFKFKAIIKVFDEEKEYANYDIKFVENLSAVSNISDEENIAPEEKEVKNLENENKKDKELLFGYERDKVEKYGLIAIVCVLFVVVIILSIMLYKKSARLNEYEDKEYIEKELNENNNYNEYSQMNNKDSESKEEDILENEESQDEKKEENDNSYKYEPKYRNPRRISEKSGGRHF